MARDFDSSIFNQESKHIFHEHGQNPEFQPVSSWKLKISANNTKYSIFSMKHRNDTLQADDNHVLRGEILAITAAMCSTSVQIHILYT